MAAIFTDIGRAVDAMGWYPGQIVTGFFTGSPLHRGSPWLPVPPCSEHILGPVAGRSLSSQPAAPPTEKTPALLEGGDSIESYVKVENRR